MDFFGGFKASKLKPQLKMAVHRLQINSNQKVAQIKNQKRDIAKLLGEKPHPKEEKARIRAEALIREDHTVEAYEILQLNCELLAERIKLLSSERTCPPDMVSVVSTVIWASARVDLPEFQQIRKQFRSKYGKEFDKRAMEDVEIVNERVFSKLSIQPPPALLVETYLEKIAEEFNVDWKPEIPLNPEDMALPAKPPTGASIPGAVASGYAEPPVVEAYEQPAPALPTPPSFHAKPSAPTASTTAGVHAMPPPGVPGAHAVAYPTLEEKASMPTATVGLPVAPPFVEHDSEDDDDRADIYVPPSRPRSAPAVGKDDDLDIPSAPSNAVERGKGDGDDDNDGDGDGGGELYTQDSFLDLQARFANLKK